MAAIGDFPCKVIDTSAAFRTTAGWAYGFPELGESYKTAIATKKTYCKSWLSCGRYDCLYSASCKAGLVPVDYPFTITSLTGYSGGGKR